MRNPAATIDFNCPIASPNKTKFVHLLRKDKMQFRSIIFLLSYRQPRRSVCQKHEQNRIDTQISPEGEVNSGGNGDAKRRDIHLALFTDPEGDSCFWNVQNQLNKNEKCLSNGSSCIQEFFFR